MEDLANVDLYQPSPYVYMQKVQNAASIAVASTDFKEGDTLPKPQLSAAFGASVDIITLFGFSFQTFPSFFLFSFFHTFLRSRLYPTGHRILASLHAYAEHYYDLRLLMVSELQYFFFRSLILFQFFLYYLYIIIRFLVVKTTRHSFRGRLDQQAPNRTWLLVTTQTHRQSAASGTG